VTAPFPSSARTDTGGTFALLVGYKAASDLVGKAAFFAILIFAARRLSRDAFGILSLASTLGWMLSVGTDFGLQLYVAREVARSPHLAAGILRPILRLRIELAAAAIVLVVPLAFIWLPRSDGMSFVLITAAYLASSLVEFLNYVYRGLSRSDLESSLNLAQRLTSLVAALILLARWPRLGALAAALFVPPVAVFWYSLHAVGKLVGAPQAGCGPGILEDLSRARLARDVLPIGTGIILSALYFRIDLFLLEFWSDLQTVALYNAVFRLVEALRLFPAALLAVVLPSVFRQRDGRLVWRLSSGLAAFGVVVAAVLYGSAPRIVGLAYGAAYLPAVPAFRVLLMAFPLLSLNYGLTHQLIGWDGQRAYAAICGAALVVNLLMNALLIPRLASVGAAWSTLGTEIFLTGACGLMLLAKAPAHTASAHT
jgi:O-antigen/teichoic acid export membrane protein